MWAELTYGGNALLIPAVGWEKALLPGIAGYESRWDDGNETWSLPPEATGRIAGALERLSESEFRTTFGGAYFRPFVADGPNPSTKTVELETATRLQILKFLRDGNIRWRFIGT
jgi:hypothetical protein